MTYKKLIEELNLLTSEQLEQTVTIGIDDEFYPIIDIQKTNEPDILDAGHIYLTPACFDYEH